MILTLPLISNSSFFPSIWKPFKCTNLNCYRTQPYVLQFIFRFLTKSKNLTKFSTCFIFIFWSPNQKSTLNGKFFLSFVIDNWFDLRTRLRAFVCFPNYQRNVYFSRTDSSLCIFSFVVGSNFCLLHSSKGMTFPIQSYLALSPHYAILLHSLFMWWTISSVVFFRKSFTILSCIIYFCFNTIDLYGIVLYWEEIHVISWGFQY